MFCPCLWACRYYVCNSCVIGHLLSVESDVIKMKLLIHCHLINFVGFLWVVHFSGTGKVYPYILSPYSKTLVVGGVEHNLSVIPFLSLFLVPFCFSFCSDIFIWQSAVLWPYLLQLVHLLLNFPNLQPMAQLFSVEVFLPLTHVNANHSSSMILSTVRGLVAALSLDSGFNSCT